MRVFIGDTDRRNPCEHGAEIAIMLPKAKEHQEMPEAGRVMKGFA